MPQPLPLSQPLHLHLLDFDTSEDAQGVTCWDALAHPSAAHTPALLREASALLAWAHGLGLAGPGALEDGSDWDFDLQASWHHPVQGRQNAHAQWCTARHTLTVTPAHNPSHTLELGLSLSGAAAFTDAFAQQWAAS